MVILKIKYACKCVCSLHKMKLFETSNSKLKKNKTKKLLNMIIAELLLMSTHNMYLWRNKIFLYTFTPIFSRAVLWNGINNKAQYLELSDPIYSPFSDSKFSLLFQSPHL